MSLSSVSFGRDYQNVQATKKHSCAVKGAKIGLGIDLASRGVALGSMYLLSKTAAGKKAGFTVGGALKNSLNGLVETLGSKGKAGVILAGCIAGSMALSVGIGAGIGAIVDKIKATKVE